jgi:carbonic anhydrase/acetyltransferase-like protein (isoleucine patch superfamily)
MVLSPIDIGRNCTIGLSSIVAPGAFLPDDTCIGPNSSSWEISDATEGNREVITSNLPQPHWILKLLIVEPFTALAWFVGRIPWFASLAGLIQTFPTESWSDREETAAKWYTSPSRIGFHYIARISHEILGPIFIFLFLLLAKSIMDSRWVCGPIRSGTPMKRRSQMQKLRMAVLERLVPGSDIGELAALFGTHYEIVSFHIRALGGRVGKRVYWPGVGPSMQDFELLNIGNDVVFGSRAHLVTSNQTESSSISLGNGCMIADRVVVQPGTIVGERTVLGSGALTRPNDIFPPDSVWIGSKAGGCVPLRRKDHDHPKAGGDENPESLTPFGRAFYRGDASYRVIGLPSIICYSMLTTIFVSVYWNTPTVLAVKVVALMLEWEPSGFKQGAWYRPLSIYALLAIYIAIITTIQAIFALTLVTCAKWSLIGQRSPGSYDWDKSSYCQQWQIYLTIERIRQNCYGGNGIVHLLTGTHYIVLFFRALGGHIGENCALFANGNPSLFFTEPDLLVLGDRVAVDDASLVSHINSRGHFQLNRLSVGDRSVLRTGSRLLSGASMGKDARLLEHTLVMAGDHVDTEETYQGWPGTLYDKKV